MGCLQSETAPEPMDGVSDSSPELVMLSDTASLNSKDSDSIEIVSIVNMCLKFSNEVSSTLQFRNAQISLLLLLLLLLLLAR